MSRLLVVSDFYAPHWTGLSKSIEGLVEQQAAQQISVDVLTVRHQSDLPSYERHGYVTIYRAQPLVRISRTYYSLQLLLLAISRIRSCDTVLINSPCSNITPIALLCKLIRRRLVIFHQGDLILPPHNLRNRLIEAIFDLATHVGCWLASGVATYSTDYASNSRILRHYPHKLSTFILPRPTSQSTSQSAKPPWVAQMKRKKSRGTVIFGCAGRFVHEKGLDTLFEALQLLQKQKKLNNIHILYAGAPMTYETYMESLQDILSKLHATITFTGLLSGSQLSQFYRTIDVFVLPSRSDCFGLVQAEAVSAGRPLIVSNIPGARILVRDFGCGLLFESENPTELAHAMVSMTQSHTTYQAQLAATQAFLTSPKHANQAKKLLFPD